MMAKPWTWLFGLCAGLVVLFGVIKWHKAASRQERVCPSSMVCRFNDISKLEKVPPVSAESVRPLFSQPLFSLVRANRASHTRRVMDDMS